MGKIIVSPSSSLNRLHLAKQSVYMYPDTSYMHFISTQVLLWNILNCLHLFCTSKRYDQEIIGVTKMAPLARN